MRRAGGWRCERRRWALQGRRRTGPRPALALRAIDGQEFSLEALRGQTVVIDFWATWCSALRVPDPVLNAVYDAWRDRGVMVLGVSVDAEGESVVAPYAAEHKVRYPILLGDEALARSFGAVGFPSSRARSPGRDRHEGPCGAAGAGRPRRPDRLPPAGASPGSRSRRPRRAGGRGHGAGRRPLDGQPQGRRREGRNPRRGARRPESRDGRRSGGRRSATASLQGRQPRVRRGRGG